MASNPKNKKISTRRKNGEETVPGLHKVPQEVVEIERNLIENWLMSLKHWFSMNLATARKIIFGSLLSAILVFVAVFIHSAVVEKQNSDFYAAVISFDNIKKNKADKGKYEAKLSELVKKSDKLCNARWSTDYSNAGCLLSAIFYNELSKTKETSESLLKFSTRVDSKAFSAFSSFYSAYFAESDKNYEQALKLFEKLDKDLEKGTNRDIALFHKARLQYYNQKYNEAEKSFKDILDNHKNSPYAKKAREYLVLIKLNKTDKK